MSGRLSPGLVLSVAAAVFSWRAAAVELAPPVPPLARTEAIVDGPKEAPYVGEMLLLRLRSFIGANVAAHEIRQPDLVNFDWQQFGRDFPVTTVIDGVTIAGIERDIAIYPRRSGLLTIEPFTRHVTLLTSDNQRFDRDFSSEPIAIEVRPHDGVGKAGDWWLPAKSVVVTDAWEPRPDSIGLNETARRTLTIEAAGLTADRLPPAPNMRAPGVIVFAGPADRKTIATDAGPVARAVYRFDVRPVSSDQAKMPAIHIPWFDVSERRMRDAAAPEQKVAFVDPTAPQPAAIGHAASILSRWPLIVAALAFLWTLALIYLATTSTGWRAHIPLAFGFARKPFGDLKRAARRGDPAAFHAATSALSRVAPERWRIVVSNPQISASLAAIDAALFGAGARSSPALPPVAKAIAAEWMKISSRAGLKQTALAALDGP